MDKLEMLKCMLPMIPEGMRKWLIIYIHYEEIQRIITSLNQCLSSPYLLMTSSKDISPEKIIEKMRNNMSSEQLQMFDTIKAFQEMSNISDKVKNDVDNDSEIDDLFREFIKESGNQGGPENE